MCVCVCVCVFEINVFPLSFPESSYGLNLVHCWLMDVLLLVHFLGSLFFAALTAFLLTRPAKTFRCPPHSSLSLFPSSLSLFLSLTCSQAKCEHTSVQRRSGEGAVAELVDEESKSDKKTDGRNGGGE